ncbi:MAG: PD-(D/E)XK nuclease family protein, partial [Holophagaceae bacterium]
QRQTQFFSSESTPADRIAESSWIKGLSPNDPISPTQLQKLAGCAFRSFSEEMLELKSPKEKNNLTLIGGTYLHRLLSNLHQDHPTAENWTAAQVTALQGQGLDPSSELSMRQHFEALWTKRGSAWMDEEGLNRIQKSNMDFFIRERLDDLARFIVWDLR